MESTLSALTLDTSSASSMPELTCPVSGLSGDATPHAETDTMTCPFSGKKASDVSSEPKCPVSMDGSSFQEVDSELLRTSIQDRAVYLTDFLMFGRPQQNIIKKVSPLIHDSIPDVVDKLYAKLFEFDITKKVFMERNTGFDGELPTTMNELTLESPQLVYRKIFMKSWARRVLTADYSNPKTWVYLDKVGIMHTGVKSFKHLQHLSPLHVPYRDCALALGWVLTALQTAVLELPEDKLPMSEKIEAVAALNKVIWIQNDLFARHYITTE